MKDEAYVDCIDYLLRSCFSVLPVLGYHALPAAAQVSRLEKLLISQGMLEGNKLVPSAAEPERSIRESITDAVMYIADSRDAELPAWFDRDLRNSGTFKEKLGFEQTWPEPEVIDPKGAGGYMGTSLYLKESAVDISGYQWAIRPQESYKRGEEAFGVNGKRGLYEIYWNMNYPNGIPSLRIMLDEQLILEKNMNDYIDRITSKYPPGREGSREADIEDMSFVLETPEVKVMLIFDNIDINVNPSGDTIYWINLRPYMKEKRSFNKADMLEGLYSSFIQTALYCLESISLYLLILLPSSIIILTFA